MSKFLLADPRFWVCVVSFGLLVGVFAVWANIDFALWQCFVLGGIAGIGLGTLWSKIDYP